MSTSLAAIKASELLQGRATGRLGVEGFKDHCPEWLAESLRAEAEAKSTPPPGGETEVPADATRH